MMMKDLPSKLLIICIVFILSSSISLAQRAGNGGKFCEDKIRSSIYKIQIEQLNITGLNISDDNDKNIFIFNKSDFLGLLNKSPIVHAELSFPYFVISNEIYDDTLNGKFIIYYNDKLCTEVILVHQDDSVLKNEKNNFRNNNSEIQFKSYLNKYIDYYYDLYSKRK